jgi:microcystin-dependent protein
MACEPPLTNTQIATMLAFRSCAGGQVLPGEALATCVDLQTAIAGIDIPPPATVARFYNSAGTQLADGACIATCADITAASAAHTALVSTVTTLAAGVPTGLTITGTVLSLDGPGGVIDSVSLAGLGGGGGGTDGVVTNVQLTGTNLVFSGTNGGFNGSVSLASLAGGAADGVVTNVQLTGTNLVFTGAGGGFNGTVDLSALAGGGGGGGDVTGVTATAPITVTGSGGPVPNVALDIPALVALIQPLLASQVPAGNIMSRADNTVPAGWALCDGTNGTPDLRDMFIVAAGPTYPVGTTGGSATHDHGGVTGDYTITAANIPEHTHALVAATTSNQNLTANPGVAAAWSTANSSGNQDYDLKHANGNPATIGITGPAGGDGLGGTTPHSHAIQNGSALPPYYSLIFVMKL